jgi:hypothetical protein
VKLTFGDYKGICDECGSTDTKVVVEIGKHESILCLKCYRQLLHDIIATLVAIHDTITTIAEDSPGKPL